MAPNKATYDTAMKRAHEFAWANQWERAMKEYGRALTEFPEDRAAQRNMAQCLFRLRQWPQALDAYQNLIKSDPNDLFAINRLAEIYLALGQQESALAIYGHLADLYIANNQINEAIRALRDLSQVVPANKGVHSRLLELAQQIEDAPAQAIEHMALSAIELEDGSLGKAQQHADAAASLDPDNPDVRRWVFTVRQRIARSAGTVSLAGDDSLMGRMSAVPGTHMFTQIAPDPTSALILADQANEAQNKGDYRTALELYDQAVRAGALQAATFYNAGLLNQQMGRPQAAIPFLERAMQDPEYATSSNYALGQCYSALRNFPKAVVAFERALSLIEWSKLTRNEADELVELYTAAAEANLADNNPGRAASLYTDVVKSFKERRWTHPRMADLEKKAQELYNSSIEAKLKGIGRGSNFLDPSKLRTDHAEAQPIEATRMMLESEAGEGTSQLHAGTKVISDSNLFSTLQPSEAPTTIMRTPGSNLRSITEYLRASRVPGGMDDSPTGNQALASLPDATTDLPLVQPWVDPETLASLPNTTLTNIEQQSLAVQQLLAEGEQAMSKSQWDVAIDTCMAVIGIEPAYLPIHMMLGDIYLHQGKAEEAVSKYQTVMDIYVVRQEPGEAARVCERLLQLQPDNPALQTRIGLLYMQAGNTDAAARALLSVAEGYYQAGDVEHALDEAQSLKESLPSSSDVALALGTYQAALGNKGDALLELSRALHLNPGNDAALARLYVVLATQNDPTQWDALESMLERAAKDKADSRLFMEELHMALKQQALPAIYYGMSVIAERSDLPDVAADALDQGLILLSLTPTAGLDNLHLLIEMLMCQARGDLALTAKDGAVAAQNYSRALDVLKTHGLLTEDGERGNIESALQSPRPQYSFTIPADPTQLYYGLAEAHAAQNNWDGALGALQALKKLMPTDHSVHTRLADIYFRQGQLNQALSELNDLLVNYQKANDNEKTLETLGHMARLAPNNVAVHRKLSDMYLKLGMTEYGLSELNTLAELQLKAGLLKDAMRTYQKAADLHYTLGQHDKAITIYERIVRIAPRDVESRQQLINMYIQSGKLGDAIAGERGMADIFINEGRAEEAIACLHQLLALSPEDVPAHHALAKQLTALGEYGQAARLYGRLVRLEPDNDRIPILQSEMQRMAKEASQEVAKDKEDTSEAPTAEAKEDKGKKPRSTNGKNAHAGENSGKLTPVTR